jgi:hypothetical protein
MSFLSGFRDRAILMKMVHGAVGKRRLMGRHGKNGQLREERKQPRNDMKFHFQIVFFAFLVGFALSACGPRRSQAEQKPAINKTILIQELKNCRTVPSTNLSFSFDSSDEKLLLEAYRKMDLRERTGIIWVLARIGGEQTVTAFIYTLTEEFKGRTLSGFENRTNNEVAVMEAISHCMGFLAQREDKAWKFLHESIEPSYWQKAILWKSSMGNDAYGILAGNSIAGLGMSGRTAVPEMLQQLKKSPPVDTTTPPDLRGGFDGAILQAAYYYDLLQLKGKDGFHAWFSGISDVFDADGSWARWKATTNGAAWKKWADQRREEAAK